MVRLNGPLQVQTGWAYDRDHENVAGGDALWRRRGGGLIKRLEPLAASGETRPWHFALLFDRVALSYSDPTQRTLRRYGTQGHCTGPGTWAPYPVEDPDNLDVRRRAIGLPSMAEYQKVFKDLCHEATQPRATP